MRQRCCWPGATTGPRPWPRTQLRWHPGRLAAALAYALTVGLAVGLAFKPVQGLAFGLAAALFGLSSHKPDLAVTIGPVTLFALDRRIFLVSALASALTLGFVFGLTGEPTGGLPLVELAAALTFGLLVGLAVGLMPGPGAAAWPDYAAARACLAMRGKTPWNLMAFLQDAHRRGVLRQAGAVYQFRHLDLQHHLTRQPAPYGHAGPVGLRAGVTPR
ncbi:hypothetical protein [Streptomyces sp. NPDC059063]|uniref:hypothetical protein n=1 Tax=unclassified Streptomyces TaxID=2593676 RepID=UPI00367AD583